MKGIKCRVERHPSSDRERLASCAAEDAPLVLMRDRQEHRLATCSHQEGIPCSTHGVPERRSNEGGGWGGVTPCVVSSPHCLPTKRATLTPKYDRLLTPWGCHGERHQRPVRSLLFYDVILDTSMRLYFMCYTGSQKQNCKNLQKSAA